MIYLPKQLGSESLDASHIEIVDKSLMAALVKHAWLFMDKAY